MTSTTTPPVGHVALIGNYPPRKCGIATFTADLHEALSHINPALRISTVAMTDPGRSYEYPCQVGYEIAQEEVADYLAAAEHINALDPDIVSIQHEFGIFGGQAGEYLLKLTEQLRAPIVPTLHTVLTDPNPEQRRVMDQLAGQSARLVVMTEMGRTILTREWDIPADRIEVIPHGIPDLPFLSTASNKNRFGQGDRKLMLSFGLLSPNKGIENVIAALPALVKQVPDLTYVVLGATHPNLVAYEGEAYRERLMEQAKSLGVAKNLHFVNEYVDATTLQAWLSAADVYVTPYLNEAQITSGTLSYAVGMGKAVVSTPYWHAAELLANGTGALVPFANSEALAETVGELLTNQDLRNQLRTRAYQAGRKMIWPAVGAAYLDLFSQSRITSRSLAAISNKRPKKSPAPKPTLAAIERMVDGCGIFQHGHSSIADRRHGYCLDDNARALMLAVDFRCEGIEVENASRIIDTCAAFVDYAWDDETEVFRNFMDYQRRWLEDCGSEDSHGRTLWAIGRIVKSAGNRGLKMWATSIGEQVIPASSNLESPRARAFAVLGLVDWLTVHAGHRHARGMLERFADWLHSLLGNVRRPDWLWFESVLAYDNARLPEALIRAGEFLGRKEMVDDGLVALGWLRYRPAKTVYSVR